MDNGGLVRCGFAVALALASGAAAGDGEASAAGRWSTEEAWKWVRERPWIVGFNYVPSTAANTTEFWSAETFDKETIDRELGWGAGLGFNSCRVFVQYLVWRQDPEGFKGRFSRFLDLAASHGISVTPVLFDDCAFGDPVQTEPYLGPQREPIPGMILPSWTPSPGLSAVADPLQWDGLNAYVRDMVRSFGRDPRILLWDLYNEPGNSGMGNRSLPLVEATFAWARAESPTQPLTVSVWGAPPEISDRQLQLSDIISFHLYGPYGRLRDAIARFKVHGRPVVNTEWMARPLGSRLETDLALFKTEGVGCYSWGLVNGRTQCQFSWSNKRGTPEPELWFHDLFHADGRPYRQAEHDAIRTVTADTRIDWDSADFTTMLSRPGAPPFSEDGMDFSEGWTRWVGDGPAGGRLFYAKGAGATVTWESLGPVVEAVHKVGPDCGRMLVLIDGRPSADPVVDTYSPEVEWNHATVLRRDAGPGRHVVTIVVLGTHGDSSSDSYVQMVAPAVLREE